MATQDFTTTIAVEQSPEAAYNAINNVRGWWSQNIQGDTDQLNAVFDYSYQDVHICKIKITELVPGKKVVWHVLENYFKFTKDQSEWKDTKIIFEISSLNGQTQIRLTHQGLIPEHECFEVCHDAWTKYIQKSLRDLITTGKGEPNPKEEEAALN